MQFSFGFDLFVVSRFTYFNMPLFFYISGFLAYKPTDGLKELGNRIMNRGIALIVPYIVFSTLYLLFTNESNIVSNLIYGRSGYWFLYDLFVISFFFLIWESLIKKVENPMISVLLWFLPFVLLCWAKIVVGRSSNGVWYSLLSNWVNYYRYYLIGYLCHKYSRLNDFLFNNELIAAGGLILFLLNWYLFEHHNMLLIFGGTVGAIVVVQRFFQKHIGNIGQAGKGLAKIGTMSLPVYVIHYFFIPDVSEAMHNFLDCVNPFIWQLVFAVFLALPIIGCSMFVGKLIQSNKYLSIVLFGRLFNK
jgi:fucose 4-O-acetylase-like acetyltransferase